jgi:7-cyano-7-deazaguanine synthase
MDSATVAAVAKSQGYELVKALSVNYGQKHTVELECARKVAEFYGLDLEMVTIPQIKHSALTDGVLPTGRTLEEMAQGGVAPSYVPARNTLLLSMAGSIADGIDAQAVFYGAHKEDHVGYPDCRAEYFSAMSTALQLGTKNKVRVEAPFIYKLKSDIVTAAARFGAPLHLTHSCYQGYRPCCGVCDTCRIRIEAFKTAGYIDPVPYEIEIDWGTEAKLGPWDYSNVNFSSRSNVTLPAR